jgi:hypothetical protein
MSRHSPQSAGKERSPPVQGDELPAISASSDIMWLYWKMYNDPKNLNYFMSLSIANEETQSIISRAVRETIPEAQSFPAWGGYDFDTNTPEGQAILGTFSPFEMENGETLTEICSRYTKRSSVQLSVVAAQGNPR